MNLINKAKKSVALLAVIAMLAIMLPVQAATIMDNDLVKTADSSALYLISGATKRVFPHVNVYLSWGYPSDFSTVKTISAADLASYTDGEPIPFRDGSLFRGTAASLHGKDATAVFVVSEGKLRPVLSAEIYQGLFNDANWTRVTWVPDDLLSKFNYALGETVTTSATHPDGALVKYTGTESVFLIQNGLKRTISSAAMIANRYLASSVVTIPATEAYADGVAIVGAETALLTPAIATTTPVAGSGLTVALASDTPAAATIISDTTNSNAQANIPFIKVNFTAGSTAVKVTTLKFTRSGISSDTDLSALSLWEGETKLADYNSFIEKKVTFTKSGGLFTVPAGTTKTVTLKGDLTDGTGSGKSVVFGIAAASDVTTDGATVTGTATGKTMSTAAISDLATMTVASSTQLGSVDPGTTDREVWSFTVDPNLQDVKIERVKVTMIGTADANDLANFKLFEGGVQLGSTVAAMDADKTVTFDNLNYAMTKSATTKTFTVKADVVSGTSRNFYFEIENMEDFKVKDTNYEVYIKPNAADTWTIIKAAATTTINSGALTITRSTSSPTGNVADNGTDIELARFDFKATGEDVKVVSLPIAIDLTTATTIDNIKVLLDGSQIGTTNTSMADNTAETFSFSNTFVVPAGTTKVLTIKGDIEGGNETGGTPMAGGATIIAKINAGTSNARGMSSSTDISTAAGTGNTLTVATGTLTVAKNIALAEYAATYPTGVAGTTNVRIASFVLTAGSAEGAKISQIVIRDAQTATNFLGGYFQNLKLMHGTTQVGTTQGTLTNAETSYTFTPSSTINLSASEAYVLDVYVDIKSGVSLTTATALAKIHTISYTTAVTAESSTWSTGLAGQTNYIASAGDLRVSKDNTSPASKQMVMGSTNEELAVFKLQQYNGAEAINISKIIVTDTLSNASAAQELNNIRIYNGSTLLGTVPTLSGAGVTYTTTYNLTSDLVVPKAGSVYLTVKADITPYQGNAASGYTHTLKLVDENAIVARGASSNTAVTILDSAGAAFGATDANANAQYVYYTKPTFALNSTSPSGASVPSAAQTVMKLDVTANASHEVRLDSIKFQITGTSAAVATGKTYNLYDWDDTLIGTASTTTASSKFYADFTDALLTNPTIPAGTTKTFTLKGDTSASLADTSLQTLIETSADVVWYDGINAVTSTLNKVTPLYGGTLTY